MYNNEKNKLNRLYELNQDNTNKIEELYKEKELINNSSFIKKTIEIEILLENNSIYTQFPS